MKQNTPAAPPTLGILYTEPAQKKRAEQLGQLLRLPVVTESSGYECLLSYQQDKLSFAMTKSPRQTGRVYAEFVEGAAGYRRKHGRREMLLKAIGFHPEKPLSVLDATGGMGRDGFLMASYGCSVHIIERNRIVAALLQDGLRRACAHQETRAIADRIQLSIMDSLDFLENIDDSEKGYDVIYLDPMYPGRNKSSLVKKEMQMLQRLVGHESDTGELLTAALSTAAKRVVVKRPRTAPALNSSTPSHSISGKTTRYDVYLLPGRGNL